MGALLGAVLLAMSALSDDAAYFYAPSDVGRLGIVPGKAVRLGGMIAPHSIQRQADGVTIDFIVTDGVKSVHTRYKGITPDLFRENSGVIAEGAFSDAEHFIATNILAKHDEKYRPPMKMGEKPKLGKVS